MATQSKQPAHTEKIREDEDAISANVFSPPPAQLQDENQSYYEASDEFSEDDNELYGFLQTQIISSRPDPTSSRLHFFLGNQEASTLHSPLASPTTQLAFSLQQLKIQLTISLQHSDTNIEEYTDLSLISTTLSIAQNSPIQVNAMAFEMFLYF